MKLCELHKRLTNETSGFVQWRIKTTKKGNRGRTSEGRATYIDFCYQVVHEIEPFENVNHSAAMSCML